MSPTYKTTMYNVLFYPHMCVYIWNKLCIAYFDRHWELSEYGTVYFLPESSCLFSPCGTPSILHQYSNVTWASCRLKSPTPQLFVQQLVQTNDRKFTGAPHCWSLWGESTIEQGMCPCHGIVMGRSAQYWTYYTVWFYRTNNELFDSGDSAPLWILKK